jgi:hypothetical protein
MLKLKVLGTETYNDDTSEFGSEGDVVLELEHSLVSLSKWESEFEKPFLTDASKSGVEILAYVKAMCLDSNIPESIFGKLSGANFEEINSYIDAKMTATWFSKTRSKPSQEVVTSELIYYWMTVYSIPFTCETWHLNRLFTLIRICNVKQDKPKPMSRSEQLSEQRRLNEERRARFNSTG